MDSQFIPVFIASPGDVPTERQAVIDAIRTLSAKFASLFGVVIQPVNWEEFTPLSSDGAYHPQFDILKRIEPNSIFIGILYRRYGTPVNGLDVSGTEAEFDHALKYRDRINILTYFRDQERKSIPDLTDEILKQLNDVNNLQKKLKDNNVFYQSYKTLEDFAARIQADIMDAALRMVVRPKTRGLFHYLKFFEFGSSFRQSSDPILIVYPPIIGKGRAELDLCRYLLPNVNFEDSKAIQKIEDSFRLIGKNYRTIMSGSPLLEYAPPGDRVWICIARNKSALRELKKLTKELRFEFKNPDEDGRGDERFLVWTTPVGQQLIIRSPLTKYLQCAKRPHDSNNWKPEYGYTYAKDYAILTKFRISDDTRNDKSFYHYFVGGIRALGTWGAGWYINNNPKELSDQADKAKEQNTPNIQILLEVTYNNYKITSVKNVSEKDQKYFDEQFDDDYVKAIYKDERES